MTKVLRLGGVLFLAALAVPAQTLQQAEALWKQRNFGAANEVFRALVAKYPDNPDYRVQLGRMFLDHGMPDDVQNAADLFNEALGIKKDDADAMLGLALIAADEFNGNAEKMARQALEWDPKLLEAQELLARIALEDNNNEKATAEAKKALAIDPNSPVAKGILAAIDFLDGKTETSWDPHDARGYETIGHFFVHEPALRRRHRVFPQGHRAGPHFVQRARGTGPQPDAAQPERRSLQGTGHRLQATVCRTAPPRTPST